MNGIGGDGLAFHDDKRESGRRLLAWRVELRGELHLLFTTESLHDDKHKWIDLSFSPDLGKLLLMIADLHNGGGESAE